MGCYIDQKGNYYEGDLGNAFDKPYSQRPNADHIPDGNGGWMVDPIKQLSDFQASAKDALAATSVTMERIVEGISLGTTTANAPDVVAWMNYRKALRACITATVAGTLPNKPPYPAGT